MLPRQLQDRYFVHANGCWLFTGCIADNGYGHAKVMEGPRAGRTTGVHIIAYEHANGPVAPGMDVCHRCDWRSCIRPDHLFEGTRAQNIQDAAEKGRMVRGEANHASKLNARLVREIRTSQEGHREIARRLGVGRKTIEKVRNGTTWAHVV